MNLCANEISECERRCEYLVGVDLGANKIRAGVFTPDLHPKGAFKTSVKLERGISVVMDRIARCVSEAVDEADITMDQVAGMGVGVAGVVNSAEGIVLDAPNLGWRNVAVKRELEARLKKPVIVDNDSHLAALAIHTLELGQTPDALLGVFVGSNIGAAYMVQGRLQNREDFPSDRIGHVVMDPLGPLCACGQRGCLEAFASRTAITQKLQAAVQRGEKTVLSEITGGDFLRVRNSEIRRAYRAGDAMVQSAVLEASRYIGKAVGQWIAMLRPSHVILGGGLIESLGEDMIKPIGEFARLEASPGSLAFATPIIGSKLGNRAGIAGGAILVRERWRAAQGLCAAQT